MELYVKLLLLCMTAAVVVAVTHSPLVEERRGRQMFNQLTSHGTRDAGRYPICAVDGSQGACLNNAVCNRERGRFAGYCAQSNDVCCIVDKSCGDYTRSQSVYFRNPAFPEPNTEGRVCPLTVETGKDVCAIRLDMDVFELSGYTEGVCIGDHLTVLGTTEGATTPVCGNMSGWSTTFAVAERTDVVLAMVLQGQTPHNFSIKITQFACDDVEVFRSPTFSGIKNLDAANYKPTTKKPNFVLIKPLPGLPKPKPTTETPKSSTEAPPKEEEGEDSESQEDMEEDITTQMPMEEMEEKEVEEVTTTEMPSTGPTTLMPGVIPTPRSNDVLIRSEDGIGLEYREATPAISAFKKAFDLKVNDNCWQYEKEEADPTFRVIGGTYTGVNEYPWQVALVYNRKFFCGGSLISDRHILTAAHCVFGSFRKGIGGLRVSLGDHDLSTKNETTNIVAKVKHIFWHLHYNPHSTSHDIALMELEEPVQFRYGVSAVRLPTDLEEMYEDSKATVTGWGRHSARLKATSPVMKEFTGTLTKVADCVKAWNKFPGISAKAPNHVCLNVTMGTPCHGDSGGPLVACSDVQCSQIGVVSFGFPMCTNVGLPAVFTRVTHYKSWIDMNLTPVKKH